MVLTLTGTNVVSTATVFFGQTALLPEPASLTPTQMQVTVPVQYLTPAGELPITVFNPAISTGSGGGYSNALTFTLLNPVPIVTDLTPQPIVATAQATALTLVGDGFVQGMTARIDGVDIGAISVTDAQHASVTIPASALTLAGAHTLVLQNPAPSVGTGQVTTTFAVVTAQVASVVFAGVPSSITAGTALPAFTVTFTDQYGNLVDNPKQIFS